MPRTAKVMPRTGRRYLRPLSRSGMGWSFGEMIMIAIAFAAILAAVLLIIYDVEVYLPEHQGVDQTPPAIIHQTHPPL